jgi:hypothetical protein
MRYCNPYSHSYQQQMCAKDNNTCTNSSFVLCCKTSESAASQKSPVLTSTSAFSTNLSSLLMGFDSLHLHAACKHMFLSTQVPAVLPL